MRRRLLGAEHPDYAWTVLSYATSLYDRGDYRRCGPPARAKSLALRGKTLPMSTWSSRAVFSISDEASIASAEFR